MSSTANLIIIIVAVIVILGGVVMLAYGAIHYTHRNEKNSTHTVLMIVGGILVVLGLGVLIWGLISRGKMNKMKSLSMQMAVPQVPMNLPPGRGRSIPYNYA